MAEILNFPVRAAHDHGMERYLMGRECLALGLIDPFASWVETLDSWFGEHPQARTNRNESLRSLLADTWLVFHMACDQTSQLDMQPHHSLRWAQLQYHQLSDIELLVIVSDNLIDLRSGVNELSQRYPPEARSDLVLFGLVQGMDHLYQQLERLFETEFSDSRQPEWTS
ncbi:hypothetical protein [Halomonas huangheensis]|uniref:Uncharacterized protein n=1 Tax=Halomonas huangheensis TaxID=1178482 RepID=W1NC37_9GAMM|nr:hypothetical protein [Halomonas huangheensis]ALM54124.1 hypothetical protein AR456_18965 [Halomonas huangheensis]ERL52480.1 hypothetical protein BJB45_07975 [Halomonas huangheensis]